jgi:predicted PurR-regulated permease PerM
MSSRPPLSNTLLGLLGLVVLVYGLGLLSPILTPFVFALILGYILNPGVDRLQKWRCSREIAVSLMMLLLLSVIVGIVLLIIPVLQREGSLLQEQVPALLNKLNLTVSPWLRENLGLRVRFDPAAIKLLLSQTWGNNSEDIIAWLSDFVATSSGNLMTALGTLLVVPVVLFYLLIDWHGLIAKIAACIPLRWQAESRTIAKEIDALLSQYLRGQIAVMLTLACYYSGALLLMGLSLALPIGILTGLLIFIPYVGYAIGLVLALLAVMLEFQTLNGLVAVVVVYGVGQAVESVFLTPKLVGERIGLHPLAVIFALLLFAYLLGFMGVLLALPISAACLVGLRKLKDQYLKSHFYNG